jgi:hypothetical protein
MKRMRRTTDKPQSLKAAWLRFIEVERECEGTIRHLKEIWASGLAGADQSGSSEFASQIEEIARKFGSACDALLAASMARPPMERAACHQFVMHRTEAMRGELASISAVVPTFSVPILDSRDGAVDWWRDSGGAERAEIVEGMARSLARLAPSEAADMPSDKLHGDLGVGFICRDALSAIHVALARRHWVS